MARKRDQRIDGHTRLYPNNLRISPQDPALTTIRRGQPLAVFQELKNQDGSSAGFQRIQHAPLVGIPVKFAIQVYSVIPGSGVDSGGTVVVIRGLGFSRATGATFGGAQVSSFEVLNDSVITCVTPTSLTDQAVDVVVQ